MRTRIAGRLVMAGISVAVLTGFAAISAPAYAAQESTVVQPAPPGAIALPKGSPDMATYSKSLKVNSTMSPLAVGVCTTTTTYAVTGSQNPPDATTVNIPTTAGGSRDCSMVEGNQGSGVARLQSNMHNGCLLGNTSIVVDGVFGPATFSELERVQSSYGITVDGQYGSQTAGKMWWPAADGTSCIHLGI